MEVRYAVIASTRNSSAFRFCNQHVRVTVNKRAVITAPSSLRFPKQIFLHMTAGRIPLSEDNPNIRITGIGLNRCAVFATTSGHRPNEP